VSYLVGERPQIRAMSTALGGRRADGTGVGQRGETEGIPQALRPVSLMRPVPGNAEPLLRKSIPQWLGRQACAMSSSARV
jgi:hypothetical protein